MSEMETFEQKRRLNNSVMTYSKISSIAGGQGMLGGATTVADTSSAVDHRSEMFNQR